MGMSLQKIEYRVPTLQFLGTISPLIEARLLRTARERSCSKRLSRRTVLRLTCFFCHLLRQLPLFIAMHGIFSILSPFQQACHMLLHTGNSTFDGATSATRCTSREHMTYKIKCKNGGIWSPQQYKLDSPVCFDSFDSSR